jgi:hypothetical protein
MLGSTLKKWIIDILIKLFRFHKFKINIFHDLFWYCHTRIEIIQIVSYNNYDGFQHLDFIY